MNRLKIVFLTAFILTLATAGSAESFGDGTSAQPNLTDLSIYRVTDLNSAEKETGGRLVDSGLNKTFRIDQNSSEQYRFSFEIENAGSSAWDLQPADELFHDNLSSAWTIDKVWYNISQGYDGGTFSSQQLSWDTDQDGSPGTLGAAETMYAKYLVTIEENRYNRSQYFRVNDTSENAGSFDNHRIQVSDLGKLEVNMTEPANGTIIRKDRTFLVNATVSCTQGDCGTVKATPRYNQSGSTAETVVPTSGTPFNSTNRLKTCSSSLKSGQSCNVNFYVNASGPDSSYHKLDVNASSDLSLPGNDSKDSEVGIETVILFDLNWSTVSFGSVSPGAENISAQGNNDRKYNITVDTDSISIDNMWIRATDLQSTQQDYSIAAENISYSLTNDITTEKFLSNSYRVLKSSISPGAVFSTYYWLDVPRGIYNGGYQGSIYFKANSSS
ncbi:hypothetical protein [Candidatus Nanohalococcus occultus]|uniref:hypothetical protein n=1 Tax=Candidatus Nanohalococcus occultus TaxID=2978047 RepID=UPI0039DF689D